MRQHSETVSSCQTENKETVLPPATIIKNKLQFYINDDMLSTLGAADRV